MSINLEIEHNEIFNTLLNNPSISETEAKEKIIRNRLWEYFKVKYAEQAELKGLNTIVPYGAELYFFNALTQYDWYPLSKSNLAIVIDEFINSVISNIEDWKD